MKNVLKIICVLVTCSSASCIKITPNISESTYTSGATFTLMCEDDNPVNWTYPVNYDDLSNKTVVDKNTTDGRFISELTVHSAYYMDTGYYICQSKNLTGPSAQTSSIYIYVEDPNHLLAISNVTPYLDVNEFDEIVIPCRPTSPEIRPTLRNEEDDEAQLLRKINGTKVSFDPHVGFKLEGTRSMEPQILICCAVDSDCVKDDDEKSEYTLNFHPVIKKISKPFINASDAYYPVEGRNVVLRCSVPASEGETLFINWKYPDDRILGKALESLQNVEKDQRGTIIANYKTTTITNISRHDQGNYVCEVTDTRLTLKTESSFYLHVFHPDDTFLNISVQGDKYDWTVDAGEKTFQWIVNVTSYPRPSVKWTDPKQNEIIGGDILKSKYSVTFDGRFAKLVINRVDIRDSGVYTFTANNSHHQKHIKLVLHVRDKPVATIGKILPPLYQVGKNYTIECVVYAYPLPRIRWYAQSCNNLQDCGDKSFDLIPTDNYMEMEVFSYLLKSTLKFTAQESKQLICEAINDIGRMNASSQINVTDVADGFAVSSSPDIVVVEDNVTLTCGVSQYFYDENITWSFRDTKSSQLIPVERIAGIDVTSGKTNFSHHSVLNIFNVTKNFTGLYLCQVIPKFTKNWPKLQSIFIDVKDIQKPTFNYTNMNGTVRRIKTLERTQFECVISGLPKPSISWYKDGKPLQLPRNNSRIHLSRSRMNLTIKYAAAEDDGVYTCMGSNKAGNVSASETLVLTNKIQEHEHMFILILCAVPTAICVTCIGWLIARIQKERKLRKELADTGLLNFEEGAVGSLNPELGVEDQADLLPYDRRWEFPREKLKFGKQLGSGAFGVVMKAEADGIIDENTTTTVAVKMVKRGADPLHIRALATELKIMIHLGRHLNVVNLLGACTRDINKRELVVIVEYCKYGNLHDFLLKQRNNFINQIDEKTGQLDFSIDNVNKNSKYAAMINGAFTSSTNNSESVTVEDTPIGSDGYLISKDSEPDWRSNYRGDYRNTIVRPIKTSDLICWSFQIARGMDYLASRKVLHGDLAARNVLLADDNIVKICDFGLAKSMYNNENYQRRKHELLPVRWMAVESIRDRVFSIQSDVWSFGITMWELFSLSVTPYPGVEHLETLYNKLAADYRLEKPAYATKEIHDIMMDCWHARPTLRPTFHEISERLGILLEEGVRSHYTNLNEMYLKMNADMNNSVDYLALLNPPVYSAGEEPRYVNVPSRESPELEEDVELKPMLQYADNNFENGKPISFSNPSYADLTRSKRSA